MPATISAFSSFDVKITQQEAEGNTCYEMLHTHEGESSCFTPVSSHWIFEMLLKHRYLPVLSRDKTGTLMSESESASVTTALIYSNMRVPVFPRHPPG